MILKRVLSSKTGTFGVLMEDETCFAVTVENPWRENRTNISCIPAGVYECERTVSPRFGETFEINDVPGRTHILFHWGNTHEDTEGCVILGISFGILKGVPAVLASRAAFKQFMKKLEGRNKFTLVIDMAK